MNVLKTGFELYQTDHLASYRYRTSSKKKKKLFHGCVSAKPWVGTSALLFFFRTVSKDATSSGSAPVPNGLDTLGMLLDIDICWYTLLEKKKNSAQKRFKSTSRVLVGSEFQNAHESLVTLALARNRVFQTIWPL